MSKKIIILGAGLSGLYLAYQLKKEGFSVQVLEANHRIGGRIYTEITHNTKIELGATWLWRYNPELLKLCKALNISLFKQNMQGDALFEATPTNPVQRFQTPKHQEISYRIVGGTASILEKLKEQLTDHEINLNQKVKEIKSTATSIKVTTENKEFSGDLVISTIPPQLLINSIVFSPKIDSNLINIANNTHTWMKDSIKFAIVYKTPFWKEQGLSGVGFSNVGPFTEMYDHSDFENQHFALMGFLNGNLTNKTKEFREEKIKAQLFRFFGDEAKNYLSYKEKVWSKEALTNFQNEKCISAHANNGHSIYQHNFLNDKLIIAGSETSTHYGGYMEGAIYRGNQVVHQLKKKI